MFLWIIKLVSDILICLALILKRKNYGIVYFPIFGMIYQCSLDREVHKIVRTITYYTDTVLLFAINIPYVICLCLFLDRYIPKNEDNLLRTTNPEYMSAIIGLILICLIVVRDIFFGNITGFMVSKCNPAPVSENDISDIDGNSNMLVEKTINALTIYDGGEEKKESKIMLDDIKSFNECENVCAICLDELRIGTITTKCNHEYHKSCLSMWTRRKNTCPLCTRTVF